MEKRKFGPKRADSGSRRVRCVGCGRTLMVGDGPGQEPCSCGGRLGFMRSAEGTQVLVTWVWGSEGVGRAEEKWA